MQKHTGKVTVAIGADNVRTWGLAPALGNATWGLSPHENLRERTLFGCPNHRNPRTDMTLILH